MGQEKFLRSLGSLYLSLYSFFEVFKLFGLELGKVAVEDDVIPVNQFINTCEAEGSKQFDLS